MLRYPLQGKPTAVACKLCVRLCLTHFVGQSGYSMYTCVYSVRLAAGSRGSSGLADAGTLLKLNTPN